MNNTISSETTLVCANCGKKGTDVTNTCNKCKSVMYCNAACKKKHRHKHKKECARRVAELHDEKLFAQPPPLEDCPICFLRVPSLESGSVYMNCCGKRICRGCTHTVESRAAKKEDYICPFCRTQAANSYMEMIRRYKKRVEQDDTIGMRDLGFMYRNGENGLLQNRAKALELYRRAAELGDAGAYCFIGYTYKNGDGVDVDEKKAVHYFELAAMGGNAQARRNLGVKECRAGNYDRALKHLMIATRDGDSESLQGIRAMYMSGHATKDDYAKVLRSYQEYLGEIKSDQRDEAAAFKNDYEYYESAI